MNKRSLQSLLPKVHSAPELFSETTMTGCALPPAKEDVTNTALKAALPDETESLSADEAKNIANQGTAAKAMQRSGYSLVLTN